MIYLLIFIDEGRTSLYGTSVRPSIQGIAYRPIAGGEGSSQFSDISHPIHVVILSGGVHEVKSPRSRKACPERSRRDPYTFFAGKAASGNSPRAAGFHFEPSPYSSLSVCSPVSPCGKPFCRR